MPRVRAAMARALFAAALCCRCSAAAAAASVHLLGIKPTALRLSRNSAAAAGWPLCRADRARKRNARARERAITCAPALCMRGALAQRTCVRLAATMLRRLVLACACVAHTSTSTLDSRLCKPQAQAQPQATLKSLTETSTFCYTYYFYHLLSLLVVHVCYFATCYLCYCFAATCYLCVLYCLLLSCSCTLHMRRAYTASSHRLNRLSLSHKHTDTYRDLDVRRERDEAPLMAVRSQQPQIFNISAYAILHHHNHILQFMNYIIL